MTEPHRPHRSLLSAALLALLAAACSSSSSTPEVTPKAPATEVHWNGEALQDNAFAPLPLGSVKARGWLLQQLRIQADGLSGHLEEIWPDVGPNSAWLGGAGESWERGPYYVDGFLPLAYLLEDEALIAKAEKWVDWTLENQREDGSIGPVANSDWWPNMVMLKALTQYQEVTGDPRVVPVMTKYFEHHLQEAAERPLRSWAQNRWAEEVLSIIWLYNRTGDAALLDLARALHAQGFDWNAHFSDFQYPDKGSDGLQTHGVNNAMAMKSSAVWWQVSNEDADREAIDQLLSVMDEHHLQPGGVHSGDESRNWTTSWADANLFGLEPAYGCCTANMHQG